MFQAFRELCKGILQKQMYYGPLLGWAYIMGKAITYEKDLGYVSPHDMSFAGENSDYVMVGTDGLEAIKALCKDFGLEVEQSVPKPLKRTPTRGPPCQVQVRRERLSVSNSKGPQLTGGPLQEDCREGQAAQRAQQGAGLRPTPGTEPSEVI